MSHNLATAEKLTFLLWSKPTHHLNVSTSSSILVRHPAGSRIRPIPSATIYEAKSSLHLRAWILPERALNRHTHRGGPSLVERE
jgi:hypothetical protein